MVVLADGMATARRTPAPFKPATPVVNASNYGVGAGGSTNAATSPAAGVYAARNYKPAQPVVNNSNYGPSAGINRYAPTPPKPAPAPKPVARSSVPSGGGGSGGGGLGGGGGVGGGGAGGGGIGGGGGGVISPAAAVPITETIDIPDAKTDDVYQKTVADLARAKAAFQDQQKLTRDQYDRQFGDAKRRLGFIPQSQASRFAPAAGLRGVANPDEVWSLDPTQGAYGEALDTNLSDFVGRGVGRSGMFATAQNQVSKDYTDRLNNLLQGRSESVDTQNVALNAFQGQQDATDKSALQDAVNKIAAKYSIALDQVPQGTGGTQLTRPKVF